MASVVPKCLALVLCERVERYPHTGVPTIFGAADVVQVKSFPATSEAISVWLQVTNGNGPARMELVIERMPPGKLAPEVVVRTRFSLQFRDPNVLLEHQVIFHEGIELARQGRYRLRLVADGTAIAHRYFIATRSQ